MKKLLVLMLVASLTALANGMLLDISVNGLPTDGHPGTIIGGAPAPDPPFDTGIVLGLPDLPSGYVMLDITSPTGWLGDADNGYVGLVCDPAKGSIVGGVAHPAPGGPAPDLTAVLGDDLSGVFGNPGVYGQIMCMALAGGPGVFFDDIVFHCEGPGDVVIQLIFTPDGATLTLCDQVIIHQIPEPATIMLLSLGGLLLRKRK